MGWFRQKISQKVIVSSEAGQKIGNSKIIFYKMNCKRNGKGLQNTAPQNFIRIGHHLHYKKVLSLTKCQV